jgi:hypothetical protein
MLTMLILRIPGYSHHMSTTEAIWRGLRRGAQMGLSPDPTHLRAMSEAAKSRDYTEAAWQSVGKSMTAAMRSTSSNR